MAHALIVGMTESGKTTLAKIMVSGLKKKKISTAVLDPLNDPDWKADFQTQVGQEFLEHVKGNLSIAIFVDESGTAIGRYNREMEWLTTTSRHLGHSAHLLCQGIIQLSTTIRGQCSKVYLFACSKRNVEIIAEEWDQPALLEMARLKKGEFVIISRFEELKKFRIDFSTRKITSIPFTVEVLKVNEVPDDSAAILE